MTEYEKIVSDLLQRSSIPGCLLDRDGRIVAGNSALADLLRQKAEGRQLEEAVQLDPPWETILSSEFMTIEIRLNLAAEGVSRQGLIQTLETDRYWLQIWPATTRPDPFPEDVLNRFPAAVAVVSREGNILSMNAQAARLFGFASIQEALEHSRANIYEYLSPEKRESARRLVQRIFESNEPVEGEFSLQRGTAPPFYALLQGIRLHSVSGNGDSFLCTISDITAHHDQEQALLRRRDELERQEKERSRELEALNRSLQQELETRKDVQHHLKVGEQRLLSIVEAACSAITLIDETGQVLYVNQHAADLMQGVPEDFLNKPGQEVFPRHIWRHYLRPVVEAFRRQKPVHTEFPLTLNGRYHLFKVRIKSLPIPHGDLHQLLILTQDITEQRQRQNELERHQKHLTELVQERSGELIAMNRRLRQEIEQRNRVEEALRLSEHKYRMLVEHASDLVVQIDTDDRFVFVSPAYCQLFGKSEHELLGSSFMPMVHKDDRDRTRKAMQYLFTPPYECHVQQRALTVHGWRWMDWIDRAILNDEGTVTGIVGVGRDITDRVETEQRLRDSEERFRNVVQRSLQGYFRVDTEGKAIDVNQAYLDISGYERDELVGMHFMQLVPEEDIESASQLFRRLMSGRDVNYTEIRIRHKSGKIITLGFHARRVVEKGIVEGIEGMVMDMTKEKQYVLDLQRSQARYQALFTNIPHEVFTLDVHGRFREANEAFTRNWGGVVGRKVGKAIDHPELVDLLQSGMEKAVNGEETVSNTFALMQNGRRVHYWLMLRPVVTSEGTLLGVVGINIDITDQEDAVNQIRSLSNRLVQIQEEERAHIAREMHDTVVQMLSGLQLELTALRSSLTRDPDHSGQMLNKSIATVQDTIRISRNTSFTLRPPLLDDFGLEAALSDYCQQFSRRWKIHVRFKYREPSPLIRTKTATTLYRVAQESLTNVVKHSNATRVLLGLIVRDNTVKMLIRDNGTGFDTKELFKSGRDQFGLLGIRERVETHHGTLRMTSWPGRGTRLFVTLPLDDTGTDAAGRSAADNGISDKSVEPQ